MITAKELTQRWRVSLPTVYKLFHSGELKGIRLSPKSIRFRLEDIEAYENTLWNSSNTEANTPSTTGTPTEVDDLYAARLVRAITNSLNDDLPSSNSP